MEIVIMVPDLFEVICMLNPIRLSRSLTPSMPYESFFLVTPPEPLSSTVITSGVN
jgi:hypothetical protein